MRASDAARGKVREIYGESLGVDLVHLRRDEFAECRRAKNHVAGQTARDGFDVNGQKVSYENPEPTNWPDIRQRIRVARREIRVLNVLVEGGADQEALGFHAQQALENALKGWISALDAEYQNTHALNDLTAIVRRYPSESGLTESGVVAGERLSWLNSYAVTYRYAEVLDPMHRDRFKLLSSITETVEAIIARIGVLPASASCPHRRPDGSRGVIDRDRTHRDPADPQNPTRSNRGATPYGHSPSCQHRHA